MSEPVTPEELVALATMVALLLLALPSKERREELLKAEQENPVLHALVKERLQFLRP